MQYLCSITVQVFSKLDTGRLPHLEEVTDAIAALLASKQQ